MALSPDLQARTVIAYALDEVPRAHAKRYVPALDRFTDTDLTDLAAHASVDYRGALARAKAVLEGA